MPLEERLAARIVDGERTGLAEDLDEALRGKPALAIINEDLLAGMKTVGDLFGAGLMQLPFVLQSAEVMKAAVAHLEPHMEKTDSLGKGTIVMATVKGDVHDIGKNLVDIILTNNGYTVVNLGIKQPIATILDAAEQHGADVIGMSGLLVKSTVIMRENLEEMNARGLADRFPVVLGGAALTRGYVEGDLTDLFHGDVHYARDAFEGLRLMEALVAARRGEGSVPAAATPGSADAERRAERKARRERSLRIAEQRRATEQPTEDLPARSATATDNPVPTPPFWGNRVVKGIATAEYASLLDERATFLGQWGLRAARGGEGPSYEELVETEGRPRLRYWLDRLQTDGVLEAAVAYGYFPAVADGDDLVVLGDDGAGERERFTFPRQRRDVRLCLADYFRPRDTGETDVVALMVVTLGRRITGYANELFAADAYRDYLEVHGLGVQLTEALTEYWHRRVRGELVLPDGTPVGAADGPDAKAFFDLQFRGCRYGFGYPACPDLTQQEQLVRLLATERMGVTLSEEHQLDPEQSTSALISHHPEASYFNAR
ncbi:vitamin B12 dependent-methionine synthase activation domain-containing protein [Geodermatophilus sabuli]|uniref:vitamin B12 dependent-methionine synthase activation domain-containing protein n=1 Tax=Geodermatophilus sabuli TaxID=1564158 RepID=UPI001EF81BBC|nr:vitamin B12 dependent-methionine synthase activation domain-containing protein [Geodermatophilus sabuli]